MPGFAIACAAVCTCSATAIGTFVVGRRLVWRHEALRWAVSTATGFLVVSAAVFLLAQGGFATRSLLRALFALLAVTALIWLGVALRRVRAGGFATVDVRPWMLWGGAAAIAYLTWMTLVATLPPVATDELNHHLAVPRTMLGAGGRVFFPDNIYAHFPPLGEMLFLLALAVAGETAARLVQLPFALITGAALYGFSRSYLPAWASASTVAFFLTVPSVMVNLPTAYVDVIFSAYALLAVLMLVQYFETRRLQWAALSGALAAGALNTKYSGIQVVMVLVVLVLIEHALARRKGVPAAAGVLAGVAALLSAPVLAKNVAVTGWPLFPFPTGPLPLAAGINWDGERASMFLSMLASYGSGTLPIGPARAQDALAAPFLVFVLGRFDDPRLYDGVAGVVFMLTPFVLRRVRRTPAILTLTAFSVIFLAYWGLTIRQVRFLIPALPVMSLLLGLGLWHRRSRILWALAVTCVATSTVIGIRHVIDGDPLPYWTGAETRDDYLRRRLSVYAMYQATNRQVGLTDRVYLVNMRNLGYYLDPPWRADFVFEYFQLERQLASSEPDTLAAFFRTRGITHLLIDERVTFAPGVLSPDASARLRQFLTRNAVTLERIDERAVYQIRDE